VVLARQVGLAWGSATHGAVSAVAMHAPAALLSTVPTIWHRQACRQQWEVTQMHGYVLYHCGQFTWACIHHLDMLHRIAHPHCHLLVTKATYIVDTSFSGPSNTPVTVPLGVFITQPEAKVPKHVKRMLMSRVQLPTWKVLDSTQHDSACCDLLCNWLAMLEALQPTAVAVAAESACSRHQPLSSMTAAVARILSQL
jgi:hypothetical protein